MKTELETKKHVLATPVSVAQPRAEFSLFVYFLRLL